MTFKASLMTTFAIHNVNYPSDSRLEFSKTEIIFPSTLNNGHYQSRNIRDGAHYELIPHSGRKLQERYEIKFDNGETDRLVITKENEKILKKIHELLWYQNNPIKYDIFKSVLTAIFAVIVGLTVWQLTHQSPNQLYDQQEKRLDSLSVKVDNLINNQKNANKSDTAALIHNPKQLK